MGPDAFQRDPDAKIKFFAAEALEVFVVLSLKPEFENVERSTVFVGCHEEVSRSQWISVAARIKYTRQAGLQPVARLLLVHPQKNVSLK